MKNIKLLLVTLIVFTGCGTTDNPNEATPISDKEITEYFQFEIGNISNYSFTISNKSNKLISSGDRVSTLREKKSVLSKQYFAFDEEINSLSENLKYETLLRINQNTLIQHFDTTGTYELIPDTMRSSLILNLTNEYVVFKYPIKSGENWDIFSADISIGTYKINVMKFSAEYMGSEQLSLGTNYGTVNADKINYSIYLNFPDLSNPLISNKQNYSADIWFSKELGIVKFSGTKFFTNFVVGRQLNMEDTLFVESQQLK
jgi:hypothetical protein